jgi:hypothetical protein
MTEHALAGTQQIYDLIQAAALIDRDAVAEQRDLREVTHPVGHAGVAPRGGCSAKPPSPPRGG